MQTTLSRFKGQSLDFDGDIRQALFLKLVHGKDAAALAEVNGVSPTILQHLKTSSPAAQSSALSSPYSVHLSRFIAANSPRSAFGRAQISSRNGAA